MINLTISLISFILLNSFKESLNTYVGNNSKAILTGDLSIYSRRAFTVQEQEVINSIEKNQTASLYRYFSMIRVADKSQLINISIFNKNYPLYGEIETQDFNGNVISFARVKKEMGDKKIAIINEDAKLSLGITQPTTIRVGEDEYLIKYLVTKDVGGSINFNQISRKIYLADEQHDQTVFQTKGNLVRRNIFIKLPAETDNSPASLEQAKENLTQKFSALDQEIAPPSIRTHSESRGQVGNVLGNVVNYLNLISIIALFLSGVGTFYLFRNYIANKIKEIAIIESLGMQKRDLYIINIVELFIIALVSITLSFLFSLMLFPLFPVVLGGLLPSDLNIFINFKALSFVIFIAFVAILFFCLPILYSLKNIKPIYLINENSNAFKTSRLSLTLTFIPSILSFYFLSIYLSNSFYLGTIFSLSFFAIILFIILLQTIALAVLEKNNHRFPLLFNLIVKQFSSNKAAISFYFFAIALSVLLIAIAPQIEHSLKQELAKPKNIKLPSLFLFNIQDFEREDLIKAITKNGYELDNITPMIFAQLTEHNGESLKKNLEDDSNEEIEERRRNNRNRSVNLSYKKELSLSEEITTGKNFTKNYQEGDTIEISLEEGYAQEQGYKIGDELTFQLINVPFSFTGEVINLRKVKWNSFQPNFFILIHPQVLREIPKQLVASISDVKSEANIILQNKITDQFPNVSIINVEKAIEVIFSIIDRMNLLVRSMVLFCLILGFFIFFSIINYEVKTKEKEINLLKIISNGFSKVYKVVILQYIILGVLSIGVGLISSVLISYFFTRFFFNIDFYFSWPLIIGLFLSMNFIVAIISYWGSRNVLRKKPILLLKAT